MGHSYPASFEISSVAIDVASVRYADSTIDGASRRHVRGCFATLLTTVVLAVPMTRDMQLNAQKRPSLRIVRYPIPLSLQPGPWPGVCL